MPGKILNKVIHNCLPTLLIYISLLILLIVICIRTWQKIFDLQGNKKKGEEAAKEAEKNNKELTPSQQKRVLDSKKSLYLDTMPGPNEPETVDTADVQVVERKNTLAEQLTGTLDEETKATMENYRKINCLLVCYPNYCIDHTLWINLATAEYIGINVVCYSFKQLVIFTVFAAFALNKESLKKRRLVIESGWRT